MQRFFDNEETAHRITAVNRDLVSSRIKFPKHVIRPAVGERKSRAVLADEI
jgi:hypothetical protein